jgi:hypothetical protein
MEWQAIGFLYEFLHGIIGVLVGQATYATMGKVLLRIGVQFPCKLLSIYNLGMCFRQVKKNVIILILYMHNLYVSRVKFISMKGLKFNQNPYQIDFQYA